jgi:hypothetical protein
MCIDLFGSRTLVQADKPVEEVITGCVVVVASSVVREVVFEWRSWKLLRKEIDFVQEQDLIVFVRWRGAVRVGNLTIDVLTNHRELQIESKRVRASCIRFCD